MPWTPLSVFMFRMMADAGSTSKPDSFGGAAHGGGVDATGYCFEVDGLEELTWGWCEGGSSKGGR